MKINIEKAIKEVGHVRDSYQEAYSLMLAFREEYKKMLSRFLKEYGLDKAVEYIPSGEKGFLEVKESKSPEGDTPYVIAFYPMRSDNKKGLKSKHDTEIWNPKDVVSSMQSVVENFSPSYINHKKGRIPSQRVKKPKGGKI